MVEVKIVKKIVNRFVPNAQGRGINKRLQDGTVKTKEGKSLWNMPYLSVLRS